MPTYKIIKLTQLSPLHVGTGKENYNSMAGELHSDTLSAAVVAMRALYRQKADDTEEFLQRFRISSAFPFCGEQYFLPKLQGQIAVTVNGREEASYRKMLKRVKYIALPLWMQLAEGKTVAIDFEQLQGDFLTDNAKPINISQKQVNQRVQVTTNTEDNEPFFFEWQFFHENAGLYCLVDSDETTFSELTDLFTELSEHGIGTDKNVGGGKFTVATDDISIPHIAEANSQALLSLYIPTADEWRSINTAHSKFSLVHRGGFLAGSSDESARHLRKNTIYMLGVGSTLCTIEKLCGQVVDLCPPNDIFSAHPIYRSGKPFVLPIKTTTP